MNALIKINANISQDDGMFGRVYNTQGINNVSTCRCIKVKTLTERGEMKGQQTGFRNIIASWIELDIKNEPTVYLQSDID